MQANAETYVGGVILSNETEIEKLTNSYKDAQADVDAIAAQLAQVEAQLTLQREQAGKAVKELYKTQCDSLAILDVLLSATTLDDFFRQSDYIMRATESNVRELDELKELQREQTELKAQMQTVVDDRFRALTGEQQKRSARQLTGVAKSKQQATTIGGAPSVGLAYDGGVQPEDYREAANPDTSALNDQADWYADRDEFIDHWAARLDAYLEDTPLEGQGKNFAMAAWKHNIDPRWSAAISNTESSKGRFCIRPHNAWGWGAADSDPYGLALEWDSWEKAIDAHAKGLSEGYGYTISMNGARSYCPNTWQSWYNRTLSEMSRI